MKRLWSFFHGLRGRLTLTYTLVTVLALLALEALVLLSVMLLYNLSEFDKRQYLADVVTVLGSGAKQYLQPGKQDLPGLQDWLEEVYTSGYASQQPNNAFDSPAAAIVKSDPMLVLSPEKVVLAQFPPGPSSLVGRRYVPPNLPGAEQILEQALNGNADSLRLITTSAEGNYMMAAPVRQSDRDSPVIGVVILTVRPSPPMLLQVWPVLLAWVLITGIFLLMAVIPFGALFGFIMSRGLTRRLAALTRAADAWSEGDFHTMPTDRTKDEIGTLGLRMRHMAERVQNLMQTKQQLAMLEERNRLARELHDTVKQQTFATLMQVRAARNLLTSQPETALAHLAEAETLIKDTQQELGILIAELRPAALDGQGLAGALRDYLETWSQLARIPNTFHILNERSLPLEVEQALYRVAQEALSNVSRHSRASAVSVQLNYEQGQVALVVSDNGVGFDPGVVDRAGFGLQSMQERLAALQGRLVIGSTPETGTSLTAIIPV